MSDELTLRSVQVLVDGRQARITGERGLKPAASRTGSIMEIMTLPYLTVLSYVLYHDLEYEQLSHMRQADLHMYTHSSM